MTKSLQTSGYGITIPVITATLCFLRRSDLIALAQKKRDIGAGLWNGYGGKVESGEMIKEAAWRELHSECGVAFDPEQTEKVAVINFHNSGFGKPHIYRVHVYFVWNWVGNPRETDEMGPPRWFDKTLIPFDEMMVGDEYFLIPALLRKKVVGEIHVDHKQKRVTYKKINQVLSLPRE